MTPLRSEIVTPSHSYTLRLLAAAAGCGVIGAAAVLLARPPIEVPQPPPVTREVLAPAPMPLAVAEPAAPVRSDELLLVFRAGDDLYMKLADADPMPRHGAPVLSDRGEVDHWQTTSTAAVADADVPAAHRRWLGTTVSVDGTCTARVTGVAVVARLVGDPGYAAGDHAAWTAANVLELGAPVLAAKLAGCSEGTYAREAALPPVVVPTVIEDGALADRARAKLLASAPARAAQREWEQNERTGAWEASESTTIRTLIVRHPTTHVTWVSVHARVEEGCGGPDINIWGLYRLQGERLVAAQQRELGDLYSIDRLIDVEGDGELELIGAPWLGNDTIVVHAAGDELVRLALPFFGCPC